MSHSDKTQISQEVVTRTYYTKLAKLTKFALRYLSALRVNPVLGLDSALFL
jgi:hypothetical protein